jgi:hypothetical protein
MDKQVVPTAQVFTLSKLGEKLLGVLKMPGIHGGGIACRFRANAGHLPGTGGAIAYVPAYLTI